MSEIRDIHEPLCRWLREKGIEFIRARSDRESTIEEGWPDFTVLANDRAPLLLEAKWEKGTLSKAQQAVHERLRAKGFLIYVCRDAEAAVAMVEQWRGGEQPAPMPLGENRLHIQQIGTSGDYVVDQRGNRLRRATLLDIRTYPRKS